MQPEETTGPAPDPDAARYVEPDPREEADAAAAGEEQDSPDSDDATDAGDGSQLTDKQCKAIELTARGMGHVQVAKTLRINRKTLWRWKTFDYEYRRRLAKTRLEVHSTNADRYHVLLHRATAVLSQFMEDPSDQTRFQAARIVLAMAACFKPVLSKADQDQMDMDDMPMPDIPPEMG